MESTCKTCAWFCHTDGKCYGNTALLRGIEIGTLANRVSGCVEWQFDGLEDWERTDCEKTAFMAMA